MTVTPKQIQALVEAELSALRDHRILSHVRSLLVAPTAIMREWDYGVPGQSYPCWAVLNHPPSNTGIAYCEFGFGPASPWGLVFLSGASQMSIGMDSGWYGSFMEVYFESKAATDLSVWRVFKQEGDAYPGVALTEESDWDSTWREVYGLRAADPSSRYHCSHSIQLRPDET
ncbi:MAG: hypothetical protein ABL983_08040 [Nitrospira sp.]